MYKLPITITEIPHRLPQRTWILYDESHLNTVMQHAAARSGFVGETLDEYLEWLASDLSRLIIEESPA